MPEERFHYTRKDLASALKNIGVQKGDILFCHSNLGFLGIPQGGNTKENVFNTVFGAFMDALGEEGTLCVPTFTYSFCKREPFDPQRTPSTVGVFTEMVRLLPQAHRSHDPIFSVAAVGGCARELVENVSSDCFGPGSFWERLLERDGAICNIGIGAHSVLVHYIENYLGVPYRYKKLFHGNLIIDGIARRHAVIYFCHDIHDTRTVLETRKFEKAARESGIVKAQVVGLGEVNRTLCRDVLQLCREGLRKDKWFLVAGPKEGESEDLAAPSKVDCYQIALPKNADMKIMINALWRIPRDLISDGYDAALYAVSNQLKAIVSDEGASKSEMKIHEYPTGTEAYTWVVPEKWTCLEARLESLAGQKIFSYTDHPLHCLSYSLPFEGEVSGEELFEHLYTIPNMPDAIPFKFKYYERDWGLCCSENLKNSLKDEKYRVVIKTEFRYGKLKVGEFILPGECDDSIVLCAHLCHPSMVEDDLTGVVAGVEVMRHLARLPQRYYTYRLLLVPETIGSLCWLSHNEGLHVRLKGGLFLEILGLDNPAALQLSFRGDTQIDKCFKFALKEKEPDGWYDAFRQVIGNDERQFNAPGLRISMLSISRVFPRESGKWPYPEYHTDKDTPETVSEKRLRDSVDMVLLMLQYLENNTILINRYKGEVFCSRYAMHVDYYNDPEGHDALFGALDLIDGTRTVADIAEQLHTSFGNILKVRDLLLEKKLIELGEHRA